MGLVINTNISSLVAQRNLSTNTKNLEKSLERLDYKIESYSTHLLETEKELK